MSRRRWLPRVDHVAQNVAVALGAIRASKLRSGLTILGVVIGVATVMTMASLVQGLRDQIVRTIEVAGPTTFYVLKVYSQTPVNPDRLPKEIRIRPDLSVAEAQRIAALPEIAYAALWGQVLSRIEFEGRRTQGVAVFGADADFQVIQGGELLRGRWFTRSEESGGDAVVVLRDEVAETIFGLVDPIDKLVRIGGRPARVIGLYEQPGNIFSPPGSEIGAIVPYRMLERQFTLDKTNGLWIPVKPRPGVTVSDAQGAATVALRNLRRLRPGETNSFDMVTQDQVLETFNSLTAVFFLVMIVLSSVALLVGGIGVMAIMMVSVTDRTREIGVRKAVGATTADIRMQFLVEAATLTALGGVLGIVVGVGAGKLATALLDIDTGFPLTLTLVSVAVSIAIGVVFGVIPANRAARLDPVDALRYE
ncbi:MAG: ABC transporter permease [Gemmatimonadaceae bacterium]|nr:ABC transporter permease [Gemmatimonadaceae bacterium]